MRWTPEKIQTAGELYRSGVDWKSVGEAVGCSGAAARRRLSRDGYGRDEKRKIRPVARVVSFKMSPETWESINESASARGKGVGEIMSDVAVLLSDSVLLENVLDDGVSV